MGCPLKGCGLNWLALSRRIIVSYHNRARDISILNPHTLHPIYGVTRSQRAKYKHQHIVTVLDVYFQNMAIQLEYFLRNFDDTFHMLALYTKSTDDLKCPF